MLSTLSILLFVFNMVKTQTWIGTFAWDNQCRSSSCCCYSGTLSVVRSASNLVFTFGANGCSSSTTSSTFNTPNDYSFSAIGNRGAPITYTLSSDSNTMAVRNNVNSHCGGSATRTSIATNINSNEHKLVYQFIDVCFHRHALCILIFLFQ
jgi:hypothetical protein